MDKEQIIALAEKCGIFPRLTPAGTDEVWSTKRNVESFFDAAIESYKADLLKGVGKPVLYAEFVEDGGWLGNASEYADHLKEPQALFTSYQVAAAILKATKPLKDQLAKAEQRYLAWEGGEEWEQLAFQLCADECGEESCNELIWEGCPPEPWGDRWLKYESEAKRIIQLVRQYAPDKKAEQRVAEYNELIYAVQTKNPDETRHQTALRYIRNAENRPSNTAANDASS